MEKWRRYGCDLLKQWYPVHLDVAGWNCVIVGGGQIASRRALGLLEAGAKVTIISSTCQPNLIKLAARGAIEIVERDYVGEEDLILANLVFAATHDKAVNDQVGDDAKKLRIPFNHLGDSSLSSFTVPAVLRRGRLIMSVSTSGASPGLAKQIREQLSDEYGESYRIYVDFLAEYREYVMEKVESEYERARLLHQVLQLDILGLIRVDE